MSGDGSDRAPRRLMNWSCRRLGRSDLTSMKTLLRVFGEAFGEPGTYQGAVPSDAYLTALLMEDEFIVIVAVEDREIVGGLAAYELKKFEQERSEIYVYDLAVLASHRRKGIATALIHELKSVARRCGAWVIFIQADKGDIPAIKLYESLGRREDVHNFDIVVDEIETPEEGT